jgi:SAM-dependent methyltransferase
MTSVESAGRVDPKMLVRDGYDRASHAYRGDDCSLEQSGYGHWLRRLARRIEPGARVLDLGCGCGVPVARELAKRYVVHGVDLSQVQIERARALVPEASFTCADMTTASFEPASFDAVVAFYSIVNVPAAEHAGLFRRIAGWLRPGGWLVAVVGKYEGSWIEPDFRGVSGVTMYWSHADLAATRGWLADAGFSIAEEGTQPENGNPGFAVFVARRLEGEAR